MNPLLLKTLRQTKRIIVILIGFSILLIGIAMIVLPGPALIVIPLGFGILATELLWARRLLNKIKSKFGKQESAKEK